MFEITDKPFEGTGADDKPYRRLKVKVHSIDRDGDPTTGKYSTFLRSGESYAPGLYLPHPDSAYYVGRDGKNFDRVMIVKSPELISLHDMIAWCQEQLADAQPASRKAA